MKTPLDESPFYVIALGIGHIQHFLAPQSFGGERAQPPNHPFPLSPLLQMSTDLTHVKKMRNLL
jgi:hypothetical protein